jgi:hypothetical protein
MARATVTVKEKERYQYRGLHPRDLDHRLLLTNEHLAEIPAPALATALVAVTVPVAVVVKLPSTRVEVVMPVAVAVLIGQIEQHHPLRMLLLFDLDLVPELQRTMRSPMSLLLSLPRIEKKTMMIMGMTMTMITTIMMIIAMMAAVLTVILNSVIKVAAY